MKNLRKGAFENKPLIGLIRDVPNKQYWPYPAIEEKCRIH
jgi:hypothetical protein